MYYIDTSVLVAYYCPEPMSETVERFLKGIEGPTISSLTEVELVSAIARKIREKELSVGDGNRIINQYLLHRKDAILLLIAITDAHFQAAFKMLSRFSPPLKTLDALHLSVAMVNDLVIVTADRRLKNAAKHLGIKSRLIRK
ncbi:MAG: type II toxin-antitoxin system VapC family toxin [Deltaproteobacteria bacterium]|nr:type II toxin-antitoxin system VapC family toxin [Deltaproteobacteria bacterium]MBW2154062.1 type II toxin-antitoxin system VapC family toxin [Deltaproteobacteria bacterium]